MVCSDFTGEDGGRNPHHSDSSLRFHVISPHEDNCYENGKPFTPPLPYPQTIIVVYIFY